MRFRPCIDLHEGRVKQIVGGSLRDDSRSSLRTNFDTDLSPAHFAARYRDDGLEGGHVIKLGPGNEEAAVQALQAYPGGLQVGGGITSENAVSWLDRGAAKVVVTSHVFRDGLVDEDKLKRLVAVVGKERLVLDLSCRQRDSRYWIVTDRWQRFTSVEINEENLARLAASCSEFLIHAADVEGRCEGIEKALVEFLGHKSPIPTTYAGGVRDMEDVHAVDELGAGRVDITVGSALDIFGGSGVAYEDMVALDRAARRTA